VQSLPSLPIPLICTLVLVFLLLRIWRLEHRFGPLERVIALCALQGFVISLAQHYHLPGMRLVQPLTAALIAPVTWVAFQSTAVRHPKRSDWVHLIGPCAALAGVLFNPYSLDALIPALYLGYGLAILWHSAKGPDALPRMQLGAGDRPVRIWQILSAALIASAFGDVFIVAAQIAGLSALQPWIISLYSSGLLLLIGAVSLSRALASTAADAAPANQAPPAKVTDAEREIFKQLEQAMAAYRLYLNPDLTLSILSRKLRVPAKQLSGAINRATGENVSRYINGARIEAAKTALQSGESVTSAMLTSGFNTKSNFNREFLRVTGKSPSDWLGRTS
jgi:AraC-like DNA-binding protein